MEILDVVGGRIRNAAWRGRRGTRLRSLAYRVEFSLLLDEVDKVVAGRIELSETDRF